MPGRRAFNFFLVAVILAGLGYLLFDRNPQGDSDSNQRVGHERVEPDPRRLPVDFPTLTSQLDAHGAKQTRVDGEALRRWCRVRGLPDPPDLSAAESVVVESLTQALKQAVAEPSASAWGRLGQICESQLAHPCAEEYFRRAVAVDPSDFRWHYYRGYVQQIVGHFDEAVEHFKKALSLKEDYPPIHARLGQLLFDLGRDLDAERHFRRFTELAPNDWLGLVGLARVQLQQKNPQAALEFMKKAEEMGALDFQVQYYLAECYRELGRADLAELHHLRSSALPRGGWFLTRDPLEQQLRASTQGTSALAREFETLQRSGDLPKLAALGEQIVQRRPDDVIMLANLVSIYRKQSRFTEAHARLAQAQRLAPHSARVAAVEAELLLGEGQYEKSLAAADRALALDPDEGVVHAIRGRALLLLNRALEAEAALRRALELRPGDAQDHHVLGETLRAQGRTHEALEEYRKSTALQPNYAPAQKRISELQSGGG